MKAPFVIGAGAIRKLGIGETLSKAALKEPHLIVDVTEQIGFRLQAGRAFYKEELQEFILISKNKFSRTFDKHGMNMTHEIRMRAMNGNLTVGQWLDDQGAARFILDNLDKLKNGGRVLDIPEGLGRYFLPDGTTHTARKAALFPGGKGVTTAFPCPDDFVPPR